MTGKMKLYIGLLVLGLVAVGGGVWFLLNPITPSNSVNSTSSAPQSKTNSVNSINHNYFFPKLQFEFEIRNGTGSGLLSNRTTEARYISSNSGLYGNLWPNATFYRFEESSGTSFELSLPSGVAENLKPILIPGIQYRIDMQAEPGWPPSRGLLISHSGELDFLGISDWSVNRRRITLDTTPPISFPRLKIELTKVLIDHYLEDQYYKLTNHELKFYLGDVSAIMHQGESVVLGNYKIDLLVAQGYELRTNITDAGKNELSYIITRAGD